MFWPLNKLPFLKAKENKETYIKLYLRGEKIIFDFNFGDDPESFVLMLSEMMEGNLNNNILNAVAANLEKEGYIDMADEVTEFAEGRPIIDPTQYK